MGSITSRPSVPQTTTRIVYVPASTAAAPSGAATTGGSVADISVPTDEELSAQVRSENLLQRSRGRFGTVLTGFRGLFTAPGSQNARKTLLGE